MQKELILEMKGIKKSFPGVDVFDDFDFDLRKGEIHCICGENGAGKSTLIKMLSGAYFLFVEICFTLSTEISLLDNLQSLLNFSVLLYLYFLLCF